MHGAHIASAGPMQGAQLPWAKTPAPTGSAQQSFHWNWTKAIAANQAAAPQNGQAATQTAKQAQTVNAKPANVPADTEEAFHEARAATTAERPEDEQAEPQELAQKEVEVKASSALPRQDTNVECASQAASVALLKAVIGESGQNLAGSAEIAGAKQAMPSTKKHKTVEGAAGAGSEPAAATVETPSNAVALPAPPVGAVIAQPPVVNANDKLASAAGATSTSTAKKGASPARQERSSAAAPTEMGTNKDALAAKDAAASEATPSKATESTASKRFEARPVTTVPAAAGAILGNTADAAANVSVAMAGLNPGLAHPSSVAVTSAHSGAASPTMASAAGALETNVAQQLSAGPGQLEVGVLDGTHGWLKIRAELGADGAVSAVLTSTATAHQAVREAVPAMTGYLAAESVNVGKIAVDRATDAYAGGNDAARGDAGSSSREGRGEGQQPANGNQMNKVWPGGTTGTNGSEPAAAGMSAAMFGQASAGSRGYGLGSWLSVTA